MKQIVLNNKKIFPFINKAQLIKFISNKKALVIAVSGEKLINTNKELEAIISEDYSVAYPDGIGTVLALKRIGVKAAKIPGVELWLDFMKLNYTKRSFYFIGSSETVIKETVAKLKEEFYQIDIRGFKSGFFKEDELITIIKEIKSVSPDVIMVAMGTPKQEILMDKLYKNHKALYFGLGGSFDIYSGLKKRAPKLFIKLGMEWFYRFVKEPTRLKRQLTLIKVFYKIIFRKL